MNRPANVARVVPAAVLHGRAVRAYDAFPLLVGPLPLAVASVEGSGTEALRAGLPEGPATAEAVAVRLRRAGGTLQVEGPTGPGATSLGALVRAERARGRASVDVWRADPSLLTELRLGAWTAGRMSARALRQVLLPVVGVVAAVLDRRAVANPDGIEVRAIADAAFWAGVRRGATAAEWQLLRTSYVSLCYHRVAGEFLPGQERLDLSPSRLRAQTRLLRAFGWRPMSTDELLALHRQERIPRRRRYVLTFDDGFPDALQACVEHVEHRPHAYVVTAVAGAPADWVPGGTRVADWAEVRAAQCAGVEVGGHGRRHRPLAGLAPEELDDEVAGSYHDIVREVPGAVPLLAYPHGRHDLATREAARRAGYRLAWTTGVGRNGAGTDPYCLRRAGVREPDTLPAFLWKAVTGELLPRAWARRLAHRPRGRPPLARAEAA